jgi:hypothetical protein
MFGSNAVDPVCSLQKFQHNSMARTCTLMVQVRHILHQLSCTEETVQNASKYEFCIHWSGSDIAKNSNIISSQTCALMAPARPVLHCLSWSNETVRNVTKHYIWVLGPTRMRSLRKILTQLHCTMLCINITSSVRTAPTFVQYWNSPRRSKI